MQVGEGGREKKSLHPREKKNSHTIFFGRVCMFGGAHLGENRYTVEEEKGWKSYFAPSLMGEGGGKKICDRVNYAERKKNSTPTSNA